MPQVTFGKLAALIFDQGLFFRGNDGLNRPGILPHLRIVAFLWILAHGYSSDTVNDYVGISDTNVMKSLRAFRADVVNA